ncbi:MAG: metallophosphoesterase, partial [Thermoguttaceae bacterium]|nr:metallophosphoesterase [Thermoguttaceae bacterium]
EEKVPVDPNLVAIFSDIHCPPAGYQREMFQVRINDLLALRPRPAHLLIYGDFAYTRGELADYQTLLEMMKPIEAAGIAWDVAFGNHDRRNNFAKVFTARKSAAPEVPDRYISIVDTPRAQFILLDSLIEGKVDGGIDPQQREWLAKKLAAATKPVFVGCHHPLNETKLDSLFLKCDWFAGYIYGHNHYWKPVYENGVPTLCLPSVGHWGDIGFVTLELKEHQAVFQLHQYDFWYPMYGIGSLERKSMQIQQYGGKPVYARTSNWQQHVKRNNGSLFVVPLPTGPTK